MNKTIEALLRGYIFFKVNEKVFFRYNSALAEKNRIDGDVNFNGDVKFSGFNIFYMFILKPYRYFFLRIVNPQIKYSVTVNGETYYYIQTS